MVVEPVSPTFAKAAAMISPMAVLPDVAIVAMLRTASLSLTGRARSPHFSMRMLTVSVMPRRIATGLVPELTAFMPWFTSSWVMRDVVVVPSPALESLFPATSWISLAPMFMAGSSSSMSRAIVTPSFTISGAPYARSRTTFRPLGPSVTLTASATALIPATSCARDASPKRTFFASSAGARGAIGRSATKADAHGRRSAVQ